MKTRRYIGQQMQVKEHRNRETMHKFLNTGGNGVAWAEYAGDLKRGTYTMLGGQWRDIRSVPPELRSLLT